MKAYTYLAQFGKFKKAALDNTHEWIYATITMLLGFKCIVCMNVYYFVHSMEKL